MLKKIANMFKSSWKSLLKLIVEYVGIPVLNLTLVEHTAKVDIVVKKLDELNDVISSLSKGLADKNISKDEVEELVAKIKLLISKLDKDDDVSTTVVSTNDDNQLTLNLDV